MKPLLMWLIFLYQACVSPLLKVWLGSGRMCRFVPTCSEYTKQSIIRHGVLKGFFLGGKRIITCQSFFGKNAYGTTV